MPDGYLLVVAILELVTFGIVARRLPLSLLKAVLALDLALALILTQRTRLVVIFAHRAGS